MPSSVRTVELHNIAEGKKGRISQENCIVTKLCIQGGFYFSLPRELFYYFSINEIMEADNYDCTVPKKFLGTM